MTNPEDAVRPVLQYAEAKTHLDMAMQHLHRAMAITPWFAFVEPMGEIANQVAIMRNHHLVAFKKAADSQEPANALKPGHKRYVCKHGTVVQQCRCPGPHTQVTVACPPHCPQKEDGESEAAE